jgi:hypothetical protein
VSDKTLKNPHPIFLTKDGAVQTSQQIRAHALCSQCEQSLNKNGEDWMLDNFWKEHGGFPLRQKLKAIKPLGSIDGKAIYRGTAIGGVEVRKLSFFALSIFWRASLPVWRINRKRASFISLGSKYEENLRQYLLSNADLERSLSLWVWVSNSAEPVQMINIPYGVRYEAFRVYHFVIPGLFFSLIVGAQQPEGFRQHCFVKSANAPLLLANDFDNFLYKRLFQSTDLARLEQPRKRNSRKSSSG